jgi:hypothetical protein
LGSITWSNETHVNYVPSRDDFRAEGIHNDLWWKRGELVQFQKDAAAELAWTMKTHHLDVQAAIKFLSQHQDEKESTISEQLPQSPSGVACSFSDNNSLLATHQHFKASSTSASFDPNDV